MLSISKNHRLNTNECSSIHSTRSRSTRKNINGNDSKKIGGGGTGRVGKRGESVGRNGNNRSTSCGRERATSLKNGKINIDSSSIHSSRSRSTRKNSNSNDSKKNGGSGSSGRRTGRVGKRSKSVGRNGNNRSTSCGRERTTSLKNGKINLDASSGSFSFDDRALASTTSIFDASFFDASADMSLYLDEAPKVPQRHRKSGKQNIHVKDGSETVVDSIIAVKRTKRKKSNIKKRHTNDQQRSSESNMDDVDPDTAMQMVQSLQRKFKQSQREVLRLSQITKKQKIQNLKLKLDEKENALRKQQLELHQQKKQISKRNINGGSDHLVEQITELMNENNTLLDRMGVEKAQAGIKLNQKDEELRFLQEELKCMRSEKGERDFGGGGGCASKTKDNNDKLKIWNKKKDIDDKTHRKEMKALQDRVESLQVSNHKLKCELGNATLTIHEEDDEEIRRAKEVAKAVSEYGLTRAKTARVAKDKMYNVLLKKSKSDESSLPALGLSSFTSKNNDTNINSSWKEKRLKFNLKIVKL
jgi:hypothetical protein